MTRFETRTFNADYLIEELGVTWRGSAVIFDEEYVQLRWHTVRRVVFQCPVDLTFWEIYYNRPGTEMTEVDIFDKDPVVARRVEPRRVMVTEFHPVPLAS